MSEKRFTHINGLGNPTIWDKKNDKWYIQYDAETTDEIVELLNNLHQENEQLRQKLKSVTMLKDDYEELIESFEKKYGKNIEDVVDDE